MASLIDIKLPAHITLDDGFPADYVAWNLGRILIVQQRTPAHSYQRSAAKLRSNPIDHWCVLLPRCGSAWTEVEGQVAESQAGRVVIRSLGSPFRGRVTNSESLILYLPRDLFSDVPLVLDSSNNEVLSGNLAELLINYILGIEQRLPYLTEEEIPSVVQSVRDMIVAVLMPSTGSTEASQNQIGAALMERARQYVDDNLASQLTPDSFGRALGVSRSQLYRLFAASGGVARYIQKRRLLAGHAALSNPAEKSPITAIAEMVGFTSSADFSRAFRREFGYSPRTARNPAGPTGLLDSAAAPKDPELNTFEAWLKALGS